MIKESHFFNFNTLKPQNVTLGGTRASLLGENFPILRHLSMAKLKIAVGAAREPHWHPNADEMAYCVKGKSLMTVFGPGAAHDTFTLHEGELAYIPRGSIHNIVNIGETELEFLNVFNSPTPEDLSLLASIHSMSDEILASTLKTKPHFFTQLKKGKLDIFITNSGYSYQKPFIPSIPNRYKVNVEGINPQINTGGGNAKIANGYTLPSSKDLAMYSLRIFYDGIREPHWHPNADELNYIMKGKAKLTVLSPGGDIDTQEIGVGEGCYIPASYLHHIENASEEELHMAVFFNHSFPSDVGISAALSAYSSDQLAAVFEVAADFFDQMPRFQEDLMIVQRV